MSCLEHDNVEIEESADEQQGGISKGKPFIVRNVPVDPGDPVAARVAEVLDFELARGSMPT
jgi:hypothetical protein